jgi:ADP-ribose pyrophosphatase YjhB (NUDIX family)
MILNMKASSSPKSTRMNSYLNANPFRAKNSSKRRREGILCFVMAIQTIVILILLQHHPRSWHSSSGYNLHPFYDAPQIYSSDSQVARVWHSKGSPFINPGLKSGSCWCSGDEYCMCTPSLAIDTILTSGSDHFWLVKRKDAGKYATMGGFVEVGETSVEAVHRELMEEMHIELHDDAISLFGIYDDPMRDARRHTVSAVYVVDIPEGVKPYAGDDAAEVVRVAYEDIGNLEFFADHKNILMDFISQKGESFGGQLPGIRRSLCTSTSNR